MKQEELNKIIENHRHFILRDCDGWENMRAILSGANLYGLNLSCAFLSDADISYANLYGANLYDTDLSRADLSRADLRMANLRGAILDNTILEGAILEGANLYDTYFDEQERCRLGQILKNPLIGYKKAFERNTNISHIITLEIPIGAIVFSINNNKCRTNKAKIIDMCGQDELYAYYDNTFKYRIDSEIEIEDFNLQYNIGCASGIHFFKSVEEAEKYDLFFI